MSVSPPAVTPGPQDLSRGRIRMIGAAAFVLAAAVVTAGIGRPAYWLDESTSVILARRSWRHLAGVIYHVDMPLAPYYVLLKPWLSVSASEGWVRLPSALAMAMAAALLATWAARHLSVTSAVAGTAVLVCLPSFSRFAQEARPYGFLVLAVVASSLAWWRLRDGAARGRRLYGLAVAALPLAHLLALTVVAAHLVAGLATDGGQRRARLRRTLTAAGGGLLVMLPFVLLALLRAQGPSHRVPTTLPNWLSTVAGSLGDPGSPSGRHLAVAVVLLSGIALAGLRDAGRRPALVLLACWAVLPAVLLGLGSFASPTLIPRYFLVGTPAWALLAGEGVAVLASAAAATAGPRTRAAALTAAATVLLLVGFVGWAGWPEQVRQRTAAGHSGGDVRPAVAALQDQTPQGPAIVVLQRLRTIDVLAYGPGLAARMPLYRDPAPSGLIIRAPLPAEDVRRRLAGHRQLEVLVMAPSAAVAARAVAQEPALAEFRTVSTAAYPGWYVVLLQRRDP